MAIAMKFAGGLPGIGYFFKGSRLYAGATSAGTNMVLQKTEHGVVYDAKSIAFDYTTGSVGQALGSKVINKWPVQFFGDKMTKGEAAKNLMKQQAVFLPFAFVVGGARSYVYDTPIGKTIGAQGVESSAKAAQSVALQTLIFSGPGRRWFPKGFDDPKLILGRKLLISPARTIAIRRYFDIIP